MAIKQRFVNKAYDTKIPRVLRSPKGLARLAREAEKEKADRVKQQGQKADLLAAEEKARTPLERINRAKEIEKELDPVYEGLRKRSIKLDWSVLKVPHA